MPYCYSRVRIRLWLNQLHFKFLKSTKVITSQPGQPFILRKLGAQWFIQPVTSVVSTYFEIFPISITWMWIPISRIFKYHSSTVLSQLFPVINLTSLANRLREMTLLIWLDSITVFLWPALLYTECTPSQIPSGFEISGKNFMFTSFQ